MLGAGNPTLAIAIARAALAAGAEAAGPLITIGEAQERRGERQAARDSYAAAAMAAPELAAPHWLRLRATLPVIAMDHAELAAARPAFAAALDEVDAWYATDPAGHRDPVAHAWPFFLAYQPDNNRALLDRFGRLRVRLLQSWQRAQALPAPALVSRTGPVRVGIVAADLRDHSVWWAISRGWFAHLDPARVELHAVHTGLNSDDQTAFARSRAASFCSGARDLADWAGAIAGFRPDVLVYPAVGMDPVAANLASLRLARVQLASWGHPETTGLPTIDCYLSADAFEPAEAQTAYTETLIRLPELGVGYRPAATVPDAPDLAALGIDAARPIVLCPGVAFKYPPSGDAVLAEICRRTGAQLLLFRGGTAPERAARLAARLAARFAAEGVDFGSHVRFVPFMRAGAFAGMLRRADLCLDTIGFSGFNTAMQVLAAGTPLVGFEGRFLRGRFASGILRRIGLSALVATDHAEFIAIATRLLADPDGRARVRERIAATLPALFDDPAPIRALEETLLRLARGAA